MFRKWFQRFAFSSTPAYTELFPTNSYDKLTKYTSSLNKKRILLFIALIIGAFLLIPYLLSLINRKAIQMQLGTQSTEPCENAAIVVLSRNSEVDALIPSLREFESQFNHRFHYPYVMLNDEPFSEEFISKVKAVISGDIEFGLVEPESWNYPPWINKTLAFEKMQEMERNNVKYGGMESYHHMCRFQSGYFFRHPLMMKFDYYWRVEPGVRFLCSIDYDVFKFMRENKKKYSFVISFDDIPTTIPTLWSTVEEYIKTRDLDPSWLGFFKTPEGDYNYCHFWSNFEIADLRFFRSPQYLDFFNYLDQQGGFFYERWGDAPVHSLAAGLFLKKSELHFFWDIGYRHDPYGYCPVGTVHATLNCYECSSNNFLGNQHNCLPSFKDYIPEKDESLIADFNVEDEL